MEINKDRPQDRQEEIFNWTSHALGILITFMAGSLLLPMSYEVSKLQHYAVMMFLFGMLFVYVSSTSYHLAQKHILKQKLQIVDHISIYFLIAGTYTPLMFTYLSIETAQIFLTVMWSIVLFGTMFKLYFTNRFETISLLLYLVLGWMIVFVLKSILEAIPSIVLTWILIGGASYSIGIYFYVKGYKRFYHFIWHLFVLFGSISHAIAIFFSYYKH